MDDPDYNLQSTNSSHNDHLQSAMESLNNGDSDLNIITEDGEKIETQKLLICLYSKTVTSYLNSIPCCRDASISLPVSSISFHNLLKVLIQGVVKADVKEELSEVAEVAKILGIDLQNIDLASTKDETNLYEVCNVNIKPEPGIDQGEIKWKVEKKKMKKRKKLREIKAEPDDDKGYVEQLLQEDVELNQKDNLDELNLKEDTKCGHCRKVFTNIFLLNQHKDKPFDCGQCGKMFTSKFILKQHMLTHTQDKPFDCEQCGSMYKRKFLLKRHMLIHTKEKAFSCDDCEKLFNSKYLLIRHEMSHTREKPFSCNQCEKVFSRKDHQKRHEKTHDDLI